MKETTLKFLERNLSSEPSTFVEEAKWRQDNEVWLKWSQGIAMKIIDYMQDTQTLACRHSSASWVFTAVCQQNSFWTYQFLFQEYCRDRAVSWHTLHGNCLCVKLRIETFLKNIQMTKITDYEICV